MKATPTELKSRYPHLLRRGRAIALAGELGVTPTCLRNLIDLGKLPKQQPTGKYCWFRRDDIIKLLS